MKPLRNLARVVAIVELFPGVGTPEGLGDGFKPSLSILSPPRDPWKPQDHEHRGNPTAQSGTSGPLPSFRYRPAPHQMCPCSLVLPGALQRPETQGRPRPSLVMGDQEAPRAVSEPRAGGLGEDLWPFSPHGAQNLEFFHLAGHSQRLWAVVLGA